MIPVRIVRTFASPQNAGYCSAIADLLLILLLLIEKMR